MTKTTTPHVSRVVLLALATVLALAGPIGQTTAAGAVSAPPTLVAITYTVAPYARVNDQRQMLRVELEAPATEDTTVQVQPSNSIVAVPPSVTVPSGSLTAAVEVTALSPGTVTISASLGLVNVFAEPTLEVRGVNAPAAVDSLTVAAPAVQPGQQSQATVVLDFAAPSGGTVVALASRSLRVQLPSEVTVPAHTDRASVIVTTTAGPPVTAVLTATLDGTTRETTLTVADTVAPDTRITRATIRQVERSATFRFASSDPTAAFRCRLNDGAIRRCTSPRTYRHLSRKRHVLRVWAVDPDGNIDATPAIARFRIGRG